MKIVCPGWPAGAHVPRVIGEKHLFPAGSMAHEAGAKDNALVSHGICETCEESMTALLDARQPWPGGENDIVEGL